MVKTRQSSHNSSPPLMDPKCRRTLVQQESPLAAQIHGRWRRKEVCFRLLTELFCHGYEGYWYTLLPNGEGLADISHALGVEWRYLLPLLQFLGLITTTVTSMDKRMVFLHWHLMQMKNAIQKYKKCEVSVMQLKHCKQTHFFALVALISALLHYRFELILLDLKMLKSKYRDLSHCHLT